MHAEGQRFESVILHEEGVGVSVKYVCEILGKVTMVQIWFESGCNRDFRETGMKFFDMLEESSNKFNN